MWNGSSTCKAKYNIYQNNSLVLSARQMVFRKFPHRLISTPVNAKSAWDSLGFLLRGRVHNSTHPEAFLSQIKGTANLAGKRQDLGFLVTN